jgi:DNA-binding CsgD family transcriptional regulator
MPAVPERADVARPRLVGRDAELSELETLLSALDSDGSAVVMVGEAGIGKSSLLNEAVEIALGLDRLVLEAVGVEAEALLPFAALHHLLRPVLEQVDRLPDAQRRALLVAFGIEEGPAPEPFLTSLATLNLLAEVASERPVAVFVDDVQWLDVQSHEALAFVARRVSRDPILVVGTVRSGHDGPFLAAGLRRLDVTGLDDDASRQVLSMSASGLSLADRERILDEAVGNPLALVELPAAWRTYAGSHGGLGPDHVPLTTRLERAFAGRLADLPSVVRDAVLVAAVDDESEMPEVLAATGVLADRTVDVDVLDAAAEAGLLRFDGMRVHFRHPLVRSGVLQSETEARRRRAHAALAEVLAREPFRRTWHRAQAIVGPDDDVADELEASHAVSLQRGAVVSAIWALERSAQLTTNAAVRGRRLLLAAEHAFGLGRADIVDRLLSAASLNELSALDGARMEWLREIFNDGIPGDAARVLELCDIARKAMVADDHDLALNLLLGAALRSWWADTGPVARDEVISVAEELAGVDADPRFVATIAVVQPILRGARVMELLDAIVLENVTDPDALRLFGMAAHAVGDQVRASDFLARSEMRLRSQGRLGLLPHVLGMGGAVRLDLGDFDRVAQASAEGRRLAEETGQPIWSIGTLVNDARAAGLLGHVERAFDMADEVEHSPTLSVLSDMLACAQLARGFACCSGGRYDEAFDALRRVFDPRDPSYHHRERFCGIILLVEAALHADREPEARRLVAEMEDLATITPSPLLHLQLSFARAALAPDDEAEDLYRLALEPDLSRWPWPKARLELAYGSWLRRQRRVAESRVPLRSAQTTLRAIGATAWAEQARAELRAAGERATGDRPPALDMLSAQELQIAQLAAEGLSNREIGQRLFLSPRTVGSHLYRIFPKLDITSRGQLAARLDQR